ncbi:MAG: response regulator [Pirellulaceae bacterium]|nr:response regulator [Pirellulaceae bacterium]
MKVLVVDDDAISRKLLRTYLEKWGYQVTQAEDGAVGWSLFQTDDFPLVIADWMMPEMDGVELVRRIRAHERPGFVYCILLTARSHKEDLVEGMDAGADDFLSKPFDRDELRVRLREGERIVTLERAAAQQMQTTGPAAPESAGGGAGASPRGADIGREIEHALSAAVDELTPLRGQVSEAASQTIDRVLEHLAQARGAAEQLRQRAE